MVFTAALTPWRCTHQEPTWLLTGTVLSCITAGTFPPWLLRLWLATEASPKK